MIQKKNLNKMRVESFGRNLYIQDVIKKKTNLCQDSNGNLVADEQQSGKPVG